MEGTSEELLEDTRARMTRMGGYEGGSCRGTSPMFICPSPGSLVALQPACKVSGEGRAETLSLLYILIGKALTCSSIPKAGKGVGASLPPPSRPSCRFSPGTLPDSLTQSNAYAHFSLLPQTQRSASYTLLPILVLFT